MTSHRRLLHSAMLLAILLPAITQTLSAQASKISGMVVNESGRPLPDARVTLRRLGTMEVASASADTDREGKFEVSVLQPANYRIVAHRQGDVPLFGDPDEAERIYHAGDSVTLVLTKGGVITGTVTDQAGEPIVGVNVHAQVVHIANALPFPYNLINPSDSTDDRGVYRIYGLPEATYVVWAGGSNQSFTSNVDPFADDVPTYAPASTRDTAQEIVVRAGGEINGVDIQYRGGSGHSVSGSARGPEAGQSFALFMVSTSGPQWQTRAFQRPGERGFSFDGVDDGDYSITAMSQQTSNGEFMFSAGKQVKVRGADVSGVELIVLPLSSVAGRVVLEETKASECRDNQRPVFSDTLISAQSVETDNVPEPMTYFSPTATPDERGNFVLKNLWPSRYYFRAQYFAKDWYLKSLLITPSVDAARTWTTLKSGDRLNGLTITLAQGATSLSGSVALSKAGEKLYVYLVPAEKEKVDDPLRFYAAAVREGKVALHNLAPGRYLVFAQAVGNELPLTKLRSPGETAYRTRLRHDAETLKTEIELKPCQQLTDVKIRTRS